MNLTGSLSTPPRIDRSAVAIDQPDLRPEVINGRSWARSRPMACPWCGQAIYAYQAEDNPQEPNVTSPEPSAGFGARETCGSWQCREAEDQHQWHRRIDWRTAHPPQPILVKAEDAGRRRVS